MKFLIPLLFLTVACMEPQDLSEDSAFGQVDGPFAYDTTLDQISYMSCEGANFGSYSKETFFTFRFGSYSNSAGFRLSSDFISSVNSSNRAFEALTMNERNKSTILQGALRHRQDPRSDILSSSGSAVNGRHFYNMLSPLGNPTISDFLVHRFFEESKLSPLRYWRTENVAGARLEGSLYFSDVESSSLREHLRNNYSLAITYTHSSARSGVGSDFRARSPADFAESSDTHNNQKVYGRAYNLRFQQPHQLGLPAAFPENVLHSIEERSLSDSNQIISGSWTCPQSLQLMIVRPEDLGNSGVNCQRQVDPQDPPETLRIIRRTLRVEEWYVDLTNRCVIPKASGTGCYGHNPEKILYSPRGEDCRFDSEPACPHHVSICVRQN